MASTPSTPQKPRNSRNPIPSNSPQAVAPSGLPYGYVPAYLPGSASLVEELDKRLLIVLRDGRHLIGTLRSFDQFGNMVMAETSERRMCWKDGVSYFCDVPLGLYVVRGDSMVLLGQVGEMMPEDRMKAINMEELEKMMKEHGTGALNWDFDLDLQA